jgi:hypothetical protein
MKVTGSSGPSPLSGGASAKPAAAASGFTLGESDSAAPAASTARAAGPSAVSSTDALLALQSVEGPLERRRRAVKRAGRLLDTLDDVKKAMLGAGGESQALQRLAQAVREQRDPFGDDAKLTGVLDEIETRAAVELAKAEMSRLAA